MAQVLRWAKAGALVLGLWSCAACHPTTAQAGGGAGGCAPPPWAQAFPRPGQPDAELAACLKDKAYQARTVNVPLDSKAAGLIAQCEVEVDRFEGTMTFGGGTGSAEERAAIEQRAQQQARAAVAAYQACPAG